jgi:flagellar protein FliO/FliZ
MTPDDYFRVIFGLLTVIGLIGVAAIAARKAGLATFAPGVTGKRRLGVVETLSLDARRRLLIVKCDDREHLIILGAQNETLIDADLEPRAASPVRPVAPRNPFAELRRALAGADQPAEDKADDKAA